MFEFNEENSEDIINAFKAIEIFSMIKENPKVSLGSLKYNKATCGIFHGDMPLTQSVISDLIERNVELISSGSILEEVRAASRFVLCSENYWLEGFYKDYLKSLNEDNRSLSDFGDDKSLSFFDSIGIRYLEINVPFATKYRSSALVFMEYIPYLIQRKFNLSSCLYIDQSSEMNLANGYFNVFIFYVDYKINSNSSYIIEKYPFLEDLPTDELFKDFIEFIYDEVEGE